MPIDEGVNIDLQFLILEVKKQGRASLSMIDKPTKGKVRKIRVREDYVDNLKNTLVNKSYFNIHRHVEHERQMNYFKALITIATNLERCADFFESIADQMLQVGDPDQLRVFELRKYYTTIHRGLDAIYPAFTDHDLDLAQKICDYKRDLDNLFEGSFSQIRSNLRQGHCVDDMLALLETIRYLVRVGDSFLNIGEAILDIHVGEKMGIMQFRHLRRGLESQNIDISDGNVDFQPVMNTRSGSRILKITHESVVGEPRRIFYKEGSRDKLDEEVEGLRLWQKRFPGWTPQVLWHHTHKQHATLLLEYIEGQDLLEILISGRGQMEQALTLLMDTLNTQWSESHRKKSVKTDYIRQLVRRKDDIHVMHSNLFTLDETMLSAARKLERRLKAPFSTLVHGDFNIDNIIIQIIQRKPGRLYYVDVHRSGYGDYVQDVSVFLASNFRIPIFSSDVRRRLNRANEMMFECASGYAQARKDGTFEARLALGLFRSLITSTRFLFDEGFASDLFGRAMLLLGDLLAQKRAPEEFRLRKEYFTYE